jgi:hypothetical protein
MKKITWGVLLGLLVMNTVGAGEITSLSQVFAQGWGILDSDGDSLADTTALQIILPDDPNAHELAVAADIAARVNLESLVVDFSRVARESEVPDLKTGLCPLYIGTRTRFIRQMIREKGLPGTNLDEHQGVVMCFHHLDRHGLALLAGSDKSLLQTGRAFFLRWPYLWDIWGRSQGHTFSTLEKDIRGTLSQAGVILSDLRIHSALYEFPPMKSSYEAVKRLRFDRGEIKALGIEMDFTDLKQQALARKVLESLRQHHLSGEQTEVLSYPGCARLRFSLIHAEEENVIEIERVGYPKRFLTPGYKSPRTPRIPAKNFDLLNFLSTQAAFSDSDRDGIADRINTKIILSPQADFAEVHRLASRLVLPTAGGSFPLTYLDSEIEKPEALDAALLIGKDNVLIQDLLKAAKLSPPELRENQALVQVVPEAFNKSNAIAILGADKTGMGKTLDYLSQVFPYLSVYRDGSPQIQDVQAAWEDFLAGKQGSAEAFLYEQLQDAIDRIKDKDLVHVDVNFFLPRHNTVFQGFIEKFLQDSLQVQKLQVAVHALDDSKVVFEKSHDFIWEADEALTLLKEQLQRLPGSQIPLNIDLGLSESPQVRTQLKQKIIDLLSEHSGRQSSVSVNSAYKQGFFWLRETILPKIQSDPEIGKLLIRFVRAEDDFTQPKRFYSDPYRWLQELYPIDDILALETQLELGDISFEMTTDAASIYEVHALTGDGRPRFKETFTPQTRSQIYLKELPEWGEVTLTTGWIRIQEGEKTLFETQVKSDLERFWDFYQDEVLKEVYQFILKKTGNEPSFKQQPYFKRLLVELWLSEPDFQLGLDEEIISSLEAMHDELYFDTLDFFRGITDVELKDEEVPEDSSRYSAPGNILPMFHPSLEGKPGKVKVTFEDWLAQSPRMEVEWQAVAKEKHNKKVSFPKFKPESLRFPALIYDGHQGCIDSLYTEIVLEKEKDYLSLIETLATLEELASQGILDPAFSFPGLDAVVLRLKHKELIKTMDFPVSWDKNSPAEPSHMLKAADPIVPTTKIISPDMCLDIVQQLSARYGLKSYIAGRSYQNRDIAVLEIFTPQEQYVSLPRLQTFKPTLYLNGRQHANEVSATNYILKLAELLATDKSYAKYLDRVNFVLHPLENPDGAELAYDLQKLTPFHSLHAGRYSALGIDIGYQVGSSQPLLPEAKVRRELQEKWLPDIHLNLHGYPSHEWVQPFSNYSPYMFRDYWIPRGWFAYFRAVSSPLYGEWAQAGKDMKDMLVKEMNAQRDIYDSNQRFYDRYYRWAARWQPHMNYLERYEGLNLYAQRRSSRESRLTTRGKITYVTETPELMDETAHGNWLDFLCQQGLTYLRAHSEYLSQAEFVIERIEEEAGERIQIQFVRKRPGRLPASKNSDIQANKQ